MNEELKKLALVKEKYLQFECKTQDRMGEFIREKIELAKEVGKCQKRIDKLEEERRPKHALMTVKTQAMQVVCR